MSLKASCFTVNRPTNIIILKPIGTHEVIRKPIFPEGKAAAVVIYS